MAVEQGADPKRGRGGVLAALIGGPLVLVAFYVLSIGPAVLAVNRGGMSMTTYHRAYGPVSWARRQSRSVETAMHWYTRLWTEFPPPPDPPRP
jgi:hypothetical protein